MTGLGKGTQWHEFSKSEKSIYPQRVEYLSKHFIMKVDCGAFHTGAVDEFGALFMWGKNGRGQLGTGDNRDRNLPYHLEQVTESNSP